MVAFSVLTALSFTLLSAGATYASPLRTRSGAPPVTLALTKFLNSTGARNVVAQDRARAKALQAAADVQAGNVPATNIADGYTVNVGIGTPPTYYTLLVDTGSSNTWVGAGGKQFVPSSTTVNTFEPVHVSYGSGEFSGLEYMDTLTLGDGLTIEQQSFGVALESEGFAEGINGILGIGPTDLTLGTLSIAPLEEIPTVTDNLWLQDQIPKPVVGISFEPTEAVGVINGELTFGGVDPSKYTGSVNYVPLTTTEPASLYWGIDQSINYGVPGAPLLASTAGIVDTGTTLIMIASDAYDRYLEYTGAVEDEDTGFLVIAPENYERLQSLVFAIGNEVYELTADAQTWPRALNSYIGGDPDAIYLVIGNIGSPTGSGLDFINGYTFLERFYSVFDTAQSTVGLANTPYTKATVNA